MPLFQWSAPFASDVINPRIWIFWVLAGPLTILTFTLFRTWIWFMRRRETKAREEAKRRGRGLA